MCEHRVKIALAVCVAPDGRILVARRTRNSDLGGLWEFPGGKIGPGEDPQVAAIRELTEETGVQARPARPLGPFDWDYPHVRLRFFPLLCELNGDPAAATGLQGQEVRWVAPPDLPALAFPPANADLVNSLASRPPRAGCL